jgi:hypothetical protein
MDGKKPEQGVGEAVCNAIRHQCQKYSVDIGDEPNWSLLQGESKKDPFSGEMSWQGEWKGGNRYGSITVFSDGRIFAEYQVLKVLDTTPAQFFESVQVWGTPPKLKGDPVIVPMIA